MTSKAISKQQRDKNGDDFKSVARRLECDEDKTRFEKALGKIAKVKPQDKTPK